MNRLTNEQRLQIIEFYYQNQCSVRNVFRALRPIYGVHNRPSEQTINAIVTKFRTQFTLLDIKPTTRMRTVRTEENIASVSESVAKNIEVMKEAIEAAEKEDNSNANEAQTLKKNNKKKKRKAEEAENGDAKDDKRNGNAEEANETIVEENGGEAGEGEPKKKKKKKKNKNKDAEA